jgi:uncharacterized protein (DUF2252 family)
VTWTRITLAAVLALGCADIGIDRDATIRSTLVRADESLLVQRPTLTAGRYGVMTQTAQAFYRGSLALFLRDWRDGAMGLSYSRFAVDTPMPFGVGDPHIENFGTLLGRDQTSALETNDLDGADRVPYLWDLRRLTVGLCIAAASSNADNPAARTLAANASRDIARDAAMAYGEAIQARTPDIRVTDGASVPLLVDLFRRSNRDASERAELPELTTVSNGVRHLLRGVIGSPPSTKTLRDVAPWVLESLPALFTRYRTTLTAPPDAQYFTVLDAAREFGTGVASFPRVRVLVLLRGPSDALEDDVIVEVKEQGDAIVPSGLPPYVYSNDVPSRVAEARRVIWSRPDADPLWGTTTWFGIPVQVRRETEANKGIKVERLTGTAGTVSSMRALARVLGAMLARSHRRSLPSPAPQSLLIERDLAGFADEQADISVRYAAQVLDDYVRFQGLVRAYGPNLGVRPLASDAPSSPALTLFGSFQ